VIQKKGTISGGSDRGENRNVLLPFPKGPLYSLAKICEGEIGTEDRVGSGESGTRISWEPTSTIRGTLAGSSGGMPRRAIWVTTTNFRTKTTTACFWAKGIKGENGCSRVTKKTTPDPLLSSRTRIISSLGKRNSNSQSRRLSGKGNLTGMLSQLLGAIRLASREEGVHHGVHRI